MNIQKKKIGAGGIKFFIKDKRKEIARAYLFLLSNNLHKEPFGFMEDVFVDKSFRGCGIGTQIINDVIKEARKLGCYKLICTSRYGKPKIHKFYKKLGFKEHGKEFRIDF